KGCELPWWRVDEADPLVWGEVKKVLERPDLVEEALRSRTNESATDGGLAVKDIAAGEARLAFLANHRLVLLRQGSKGNITESELEHELERLARETKMIGQTLAAARAAAARANAVIDEIGTVRSWLVVVRDEVERADDAERRRICRALAPSVQLDEKKIRIGLKLTQRASIASVGSTCS
ncbi:MAG TPA: hypothetical protein VHB97_21880, partial [Polyangia bacterium]|nr:hypothetical protein [Polyangia bacterium]